MLSRKLDIKVWKEAWEGYKYLGVDSMWLVFKNVTKGVSKDKEMFSRLRGRREEEECMKELEKVWL